MKHVQRCRCKLLFNLSEKDAAAKDVIWAVAGYFCNVSEDVRNLLFKLSEKDMFDSHVARAVMKSNYQSCADFLVQSLLSHQTNLQQTCGSLSSGEQSNSPAASFAEHLRWQKVPFSKPKRGGL